MVCRFRFGPSFEAEVVRSTDLRLLWSETKGQTSEVRDFDTNHSQTEYVICITRTPHVSLALASRPFLGRSGELPGALCDSEGKEGRREGGRAEGGVGGAHTVTGTFLWPSGPAVAAEAGRNLNVERE